jgi:hypothetical protein
MSWLVVPDNYAHAPGSNGGPEFEDILGNVQGTLQDVQNVVVIIR